MSRYVVTASSGNEYQPYKPLDVYSMHPSISEKGQDPYFTCDGSIHEPHFHKVNAHPFMPNEIHGRQLSYEQLHVPGYDEHNGFAPKDSPPFNIMTGWHISYPDKDGDTKHMYQLSTMRRFPASTDNEEALSNWKEKSQSIFGAGSFKEQKPSVDEETGRQLTSHYKFKPPSNDDNPPVSDVSFYPRIEENGEVYPASEQMSFGDDAESGEAAKSKLIDYINSAKEFHQKDMEKKLLEDPINWEDRFKQSKRIYTLGSKGQIVDVQDYYPNIIRHGKKCDCNGCSNWSEFDFEV